jgi:ubiquitin-like protein Pup
MAEQEHKQNRRAGSGDEAQETDETTAPVAEELAEKIDDLLDEIDSVLEENAEEFVKNYVQKGGE